MSTQKQKQAALGQMGLELADAIGRAIGEAYPLLQKATSHTEALQLLDQLYAARGADPGDMYRRAAINGIMDGLNADRLRRGGN